MMDLKDLLGKMMNLFEAEKVDMLGERLFNAVRDNDSGMYEAFCDIVQDLSVDWLQKIYQYYLADRKEKMQDYTPKSLAIFASKLVGDADTVTDLCAGSGALTIQKWAASPETKFELYEFDESVIPFLLFNMAVRNVNCTVYHSDVLTQEVYRTYRIVKGERFGFFKEVTN